MKDFICLLKAEYSGKDQENLSFKYNKISWNIIWQAYRPLFRLSPEKVVLTAIMFDIITAEQLVFRLTDKDLL